LIDEIKRTHQKLQTRNAGHPLSSTLETLKLPKEKNLFSRGK
jgi:hypothetical protein